MIVRIIWVLIGLNATALLFFVVFFLSSAEGRNVDSMEKGWTTILFGIGLLVIALSVIPLRFGHSNFSIIMAGIFAALPSFVALCIFLSDKIPSFKKERTNAEIYYKDKTQRSIAAAIEQNDTLKLRELIKGQDLNIQGNRVWDWDGLNYLQFAVRLRSDSKIYVNDKANTACIRILVEHGSATTPALSEAIKHLPPETISLLLNAGADPNTHGYANSSPLLFEAMGTSRQENDIAILLIQKGANVNAWNNYDQTPLMAAAQNAGTSAQWKDIWRVVRYLLEEAHADYASTRPDGINFAMIVQETITKAALEKVTMPPDFMAVVKWLKDHPVPIKS
ncbi:MAG: hypothetical protein ABIN89_29385 [Chitinophagaceae bacterium]